MLLRVDDTAPANWIREAVQKLVPPDSPTWPGNFVSHCVPPLFEAYGKLFHTIEEDLDITDRAVTWNQVAGAQDVERLAHNLGRLAHDDAGLRDLLAATTLVRGAPEGNFRGRRIGWRALAERYGLAFHPELNEHSFTRLFPGRSWPRYLVGPAEGSLDERTCERLVQTLRPRTGHRRCYFFYDVVATLTSDLLFEGRLEDARLAGTMPGVHSTPTYWWPEDRQWLICTDWDLTFTLVGGPDDLIARLVGDPELECVVVSPDTRIDFQADRLNLRPNP